ncbi:MAG: hypothetical protein V3S14_07445 [Anaerolineae bacterium]
MARYSRRERQQALPVAWNLGGSTWKTPAPQGVGVYASNRRKEVIEMTDDDTETAHMLWYVTYPITYEEENNG